ncbi:MAG: universal stress protein [Thermodesulfobacteriota bacterium]|nr:universal stress protein [Thermodesulfobacteriota bacterium]
MGRKILVAVGDCTYSKQAVRYAAKVCAAQKETTYTLFHLQALVPAIFSDAAETEPDMKAHINAMVKENAEIGACTAGALKDIMLREGIPEHRIEVIARPMQVGLAIDIIKKAEQGRYDAIVLARRGLTPSRDFFIGTTAAKVVEHALRTPVWVISGETISMKIMLAVDGSKNSLRDVDHLIDMVGTHPDLKVTLFHVQPCLSHYYSIDFQKKNPALQKILERQDKRRMERFYEKAYQRFEAVGLKKDQIETKTRLRSYDISTTIIEEAKTGDYSTVVVGRRGERDAFFTGRIAMRLVQKTTDQALWIIP